MLPLSPDSETAIVFVVPTQAAESLTLVRTTRIPSTEVIASLAARWSGGRTSTTAGTGCSSWCRRGCWSAALTAVISVPLFCVQTSAGTAVAARAPELPVRPGVTTVVVWFAVKSPTP